MKIKRTKLFTSFFCRQRIITIQNKILLTLILLLCISSQNLAQDSLYLVGTIVGESTDKKITDVKGVGDINGDGYDDFMISVRTGKKVRDEGIVKLYLGSADGNLIPDIMFHYPGEDSLNDFGTASGIRDINNDGYNDFLISGAFGDWGYSKGKVFLYYGDETIDTVPEAEFYEPWIQDGFGSISTRVGDINKDGYDDFTISSPYNWSNGKGYVYLFWGGDTISFKRSLTFVSPNQLSGDFFGQSAANIGDINNDGFNDLAIGAPDPGFASDSGRIYVYYGSEDMQDKVDTIILSDIHDAYFGKLIKNAGDLNNNGIIDFCILSLKYIHLYINQLNNPLIFGGYSFDCKGDLNSDGFDDLIVGKKEKINVYFGSKNFDTTADVIIDDSLKYSTQYLDILGDINKDGFDEFTSFAPNYPNAESPQGRIYIYSFKKLTSVKENKETSINEFKLYQNYPNPFNLSTIIEYRLTATRFIILKIYDILGNEVAVLVNKEQNAGEHRVEFDASEYKLSSGVYFCSLKAGSVILINKLILLK